MGEKYKYKYKINIAICIIAARPLRLPLNSMFSPRGRCCARFISPPPLYKYKEQTNKETNTRSRCFCGFCWWLVVFSALLVPWWSVFSAQCFYVSSTGFGQACVFRIVVFNVQCWWAGLVKP